MVSSIIALTMFELLLNNALTAFVLLTFACSITICISSSLIFEVSTSKSSSLSPYSVNAPILGDAYITQK